MKMTCANAIRVFILYLKNISKYNINLKIFLPFVLKRSPLAVLVYKGNQKNVT